MSEKYKLLELDDPLDINEPNQNKDYALENLEEEDERPDLTSTNYNPINYAQSQGQAMDDFGLFLSEKDYDWKQDLINSGINTGVSMWNSGARFPGFISEVTGVPLNLFDEDGTYTHDEYIQDSQDWYNAYPYDPASGWSSLGSFTVNLAPTVGTSVTGTLLRGAGKSTAASWLSNTYLGYMSTVSFGQGVTRINEYEKLMFEQDPNFEGFNDIQKASAGTGYALVTLFAERYALKGWEGNMAKHQSLIMDLGEAYLLGNKNKFTQILKIVGKDMFTTANIEGTEEMFEQGLHNIIDVALYDRRFSHLFENVLQSYGYGFLSGGMLGPISTTVRLNQHSDLLDIAQQENITIGELSRRIMNIASPEEIWISENFLGGTQHLIDKYNEWKALQPWATNPELFDQNEAMDISKDELLGDTLGETTIDDIKKQGYFEFINPNDPNNEAGTKVRINFNPNMSKADIEKALVAMSFIKRKAPNYFMTLNNANFTNNWSDGDFNVSGDGTFGYFSQMNPGDVNIKMTDENRDPQKLERIINTITHEMMHNRDFKKYGQEQFSEMFKILSGNNEGRYSWESGIPWADYRNVKGEDRAFKIGETTGKAFVKFVNDIKQRLIDKAKNDGKKIDSTELEITTDILETLDQLWRDYKQKGIPTTQFVDDIIKATGNSKFVEQWLDKQIADGNVIYDTNMIKQRIRAINNKMSTEELDMAVQLLELWANSTAFKLSQTGNKVTADEVIANFIQSVKEKKRGVPNFTKDGAAILKVMKNGTFEDFVSSLVPIFTKSLTKGELNILEEWAGVKDGNWKKKDMDKLGRGIIRWLRSGGDVKSHSPRQKEIFHQLADTLKDLYKNIRGTKLDVGLTPKMREAFKNLIGHTTIEEDTQEWRGWYDTFKHNVRYMTNSFFSKFDVESPFKLEGATETGFHIKNFFSRINTETEIAMKVTAQISKLLGNDMDKVRQFILLFEKPKEFFNHINKYNKDEQDRWEEAYRIWENYWTSSLKQLQRFGILKNGFVENLKTKIATTIVRITEDIELIEKDGVVGENTKVEELKKELKYFDDLLKEVSENLNYVHLPVLFLLENITESSNFQGAQVKKFRQYMKDRRDTIYISDLINDGFIDVNNLTLAGIMFNYSRRFAHDIAMGEIIRAAQKEGMAISPDDFELAQTMNPTMIPVTNSHMKVFQGWHLSPMLNQFLTSFTGVYNQGEMMTKVDTFLASMKLMTFFNPLFLPMYDAIQGAVAVNALNPLNWIKGNKSIPRAFYDGLKDFYQTSDEWILAERFGLRSTPFGNPYQSEKEWFEYMQNMNTYLNSKFLGILLKPLKQLVNTEGYSAKIGFELLGSVYQVAFNTAWTLDGMVRQITYRYLRAQGYTPQEAAQTAANFHGDYAGVPAETRRILNKFLYTPTFKIAMFKLYGKMLEGTAFVPVDIFNIISGKDVGGRQTKIKSRYGYSAITVLAVTSAFQMIMKGLGWEEDMYGRRWKKEVENALGEPQELNVTVSHPFNLLQRFYERFDKAYQPDADPGTLFRAFKYEFHPLHRAVMEALDGRDSGGNPIFLDGNALDTKIFAGMQHIIKECMTITEGTDMGYADATSKIRDEYAREAFHKEFPETLDLLLSMADVLTFKYMTDIVDVKDAARINRTVAELETSINDIKELYIEQKKAGNDVPFPMHEVRKLLHEWSGKLEDVSELIYNADPYNSILSNPIVVDVYDKQTHLMFPGLDRYVKSQQTLNINFDGVKQNMPEGKKNRQKYRLLPID